MNVEQKCILTDGPAQVGFKRDTFFVSSEVCGAYEIVRSAVGKVSGEYNDQRYLLAAVALRNSDAGNPLKLHSLNIEDTLASIEIPKTELEQIDQILLWIRAHVEHSGAYYQFDRTKDYPIAFAHHTGEWDHLFDQAAEMGYFDGPIHNGVVRLTYKAWERLDHLTAKAQTAGISPQFKEAISNDYNLTEDQKAILRLLVEHVSTDGRPGDDVWITFTPHYTKISDFEGDSPPFSRNYLKIFANNGLMLYHPYPGNPDQYICTLTQKAKDAVASDFSAAKQGQRAAVQQEVEINRQVQVFLCHASEDKDEVLKIYQRLKEEDFKPWIDKEDLIAGQDWEREIRRVIKESDCSLAFFSKNSVSKRGFYQKELKLLLEVWEEVPEGQIYIIPVRLDDECEIPDKFKHLHYVDLFETGGFDKVLKAIQTHPKPNDESPQTSPTIEIARKPQVIEKESLLTRVEELTGLLAESLSSGRLRGITREEASGFFPELFNLRSRLRKHSGLLHALRDFENTAGWIFEIDGTFETANDRNETLKELEERYQQVVRQVELLR